MKVKVVITSKLNIMTGEKYEAYSKSAKERENKEWLEERINIFMNFTAKSLIHQTNQNFTALYAFEDSTENYIYEALDKYSKLPDNIKFVKKTEYMDMLDKITKGYEMLYLVHLDSDDLYRNDFVDRILKLEINDDTEELLCPFGYIYDSRNNRLAEYYHKQFIFYTFIYRFYKENEKYSSLNIDPWKLLIDFSHFKTINYKYEIVSGRNFMFNIHGNNANSFFGSYNYGFSEMQREIYNEDEKIDILYDFF